MKVTVAKTAGFCFGVKRAVETVYQQIEENPGMPIYTWGPIIHNEQVVNDMEAKGVRVIDSVDDIKDGEDITVIIRSHGISEEVMNKLQQKNVNIVDATCPFVSKIHKIVRQKSNEGYNIIVVGNAKHPEVEGICGWCDFRCDYAFI